MAKEIKNVGASVRARLLQLAKANGQSFDLVLTRFALEGLLFRLSRSPHAKRFVLEGAMLMMSWLNDPHRGTRDLDREDLEYGGLRLRATASISGARINPDDRHRFLRRG